MLLLCILVNKKKMSSFNPTKVNSVFPYNFWHVFTKKPEFVRFKKGFDYHNKVFMIRSLNDKKKKYFNINVKGELTPYGLIHEKKKQTNTKTVKETLKRRQSATSDLSPCQSTFSPLIENVRNAQGCKKTKNFLQEALVEEAFQKCLTQCRASSKSLHQRYFDTINKDTLEINPGEKSQFNQKFQASNYCQIPSPETIHTSTWSVLNVYHLLRKFPKPKCHYCLSISHTRHHCPSLRCGKCGSVEHTHRKCTVLWLTCSFCMSTGHTRDKCLQAQSDKSILDNFQNTFTKYRRTHSNYFKGPICIFCSKQGHTCCLSLRKSHSEKKVYCPYCSQSGHDVAMCPNRHEFQEFHSRKMDKSSEKKRKKKQQGRHTNTSSCKKKAIGNVSPYYYMSD